MSSLRNSYRNIANSNSFYIPADPSLGTKEAVNLATELVPTDKVFWTVSIVGPDTDYQVSAMGVGQSEFRQVENALVDGTAAGYTIYFRGNVSAIEISQLGASGNTFNYSIVGSNQS